MIPSLAAQVHYARIAHERSTGYAPTHLYLGDKETLAWMEEIDQRKDMRPVGKLQLPQSQYNGLIVIRVHSQSHLNVSLKPYTETTP